jgi:transcriptional regulator with XRE-family HTH domain
VVTTPQELRRQLRQRRELPAPDERRALRVNAGATLREVAGPVGVSPQTIWDYENGRSTPRGLKLERYLAVLGVLGDAADVS